MNDHMVVYFNKEKKKCSKFLICAHCSNGQHTSSFQAPYWWNALQCPSFYILSFIQWFVFPSIPIMQIHDHQLPLICILCWPMCMCVSVHPNVFSYLSVCVWVSMRLCEYIFYCSIICIVLCCLLFEKNPNNFNIHITMKGRQALLFFLSL